MSTEEITNIDLQIYRELNTLLGAYESYIDNVLKNCEAESIFNNQDPKPFFSSRTIYDDAMVESMYGVVMSARIGDNLNDFESVKPTYNTIFADISRKVAAKVGAGDVSGYINSAKLQAPASAGNSGTPAASRNQCNPSTNGAQENGVDADNTCRKYTTTFKEFCNNLVGDNTNVNFALYPYLVCKYVESKIPVSGMGQGVDNIYDFHVFRMALLVYYRLMYITLAGILKGYLMRNQQNPASANEAISKCLHLAKKIDTLFSNIVENENDLQYADDDNSTNLAKVYLRLKEHSLRNTHLSAVVTELQKEINDQKQTVQTAMYAEVQMNKAVFRSKLWKWVWILLFIISIGVLVGSVGDNPLLFYIFSAVMMIVIAIVFVVTATKVDLSPFNPNNVNPLKYYKWKTH